MKKIFILCLALLLAFTSGMAQNVSMHIRNVSIEDALASIKANYGLSFVMHTEGLDMSRKVTVAADNLPVEKVIELLFAPTAVKVEVDGNLVIVSKVTEVTKDGQKELPGLVQDSNGDPLAGAYVMVKGTNRGFVTDVDGKFMLSGVNYPTTLTVSYLGFTDQEINVIGNEKQVNIVMSGSANMLDDVVVVGFGTQKRVNITGAVATIDGSQLQQRPVANVAQALQGADPSLIFSSQGGNISGSNYSLNIRGAASISSSSVSPLVLIDGVEGSLSMMNPNDIESISVLKDASACAIYGAAASAGVILITTREGRNDEGHSQVSYNGRFSLTTNTTSTDFITRGYDHLSVVNEFYQNYLGVDAWELSDTQMQLLYDRRNDVTEVSGRPWVLYDNTGQYTYQYLGNFDWYGFLFKRVRPETEHNIAVSGGNSKFDYYVSGRYLYREGMFNQYAEDIFNGFSFRAKLNAKVTPWLRYTLNYSLERTKYDYGGFWQQDGAGDHTSADGILYDATRNLAPFFVPYNPDGTINIQPGYMYAQTSPICTGRGGAWMTEDNRNIIIKNSSVLTNRFLIDIYKGVSFTVDYTYRRNDNFSSFRSLPTPNCYDNVNRRMYEGNGLTGGFFSNGSVYDFYQEERYYRDAHIANAFLSVDQSFGNNSNISATVGANFNDYRNSELTVQQKGSLSDKLAYVNLASASEIKKLNGSNSSYRTMGFFGRVNYNYAERYLFEISGRYDGTSRFPKGQRWGFFPSASAGWRLSEEPFWTPVSGWWNNAKLRLSYGSLGNQQVSNYYYIDKMSLGKLNYTYDDATALQGATMSAPVSSDLTWETVITYNAGLDLGFLRDRINISADVFIRDTKNMLTTAMTLPNVYGAAAPKMNAADLRTTGFELAVSWRDRVELAGRPLFYGITAALGDNVSRITKYNNPTKLLSDKYEGMTLGEIWGYHVLGLFESDDEAAEWERTYDISVVNAKELKAAAPNNHLMAGDIKYANLDGDKYTKDGKVAINNGSNTVDDPGDLKVIGNSLPRYRYSLKGELNWLGLDFSIFFQGVGKCDWYPDGLNSWFWGPYSYKRSSFISQRTIDNSWTPENPDGYFPFRRGELFYNRTIKDDRYLQDASYIRLKTLTVGYTIPFKSKVISKCRVYFNGENLAYWSPMKKYCNTVDPEVTQASETTHSVIYPYPKTFTFGVDITF